MPTPPATVARLILDTLDELAAEVTACCGRPDALDWITEQRRQLAGTNTQETPA